MFSLLLKELTFDFYLTFGRKVCMGVFRFIPIVSITVLFNFRKCVNALIIIETGPMNRKKKKKKNTSMPKLTKH